MRIIDILKKKNKQNRVLEKEKTVETNTILKDSLLDVIKQTIKKWDKNDIYAIYFDFDNSEIVSQIKRIIIHDL